MDGSNNYTHYGISCFNYLILSSTAATSPDANQPIDGNKADENKADENKAGKC